MNNLIIKAARQAKKINTPMYIYCTSVSWVIGKAAPGGNRAYNKVSPDGVCTFHAYEFEQGTWTVTTLGTV